MEAWASTEKGRHLRGRSSKNTAPELALRRELHRRGLRFRLHVTLERGCNPDLVLPRHRLAVWVDGCFWHGHSSHTWTPRTGPNVDLWRAKIEANRERDVRALALASESGWTGIRVWECEIKADVSAAADLVSSRTAPLT
ncbi:very short patch repair endonuclease [Cellulomonas terrae]|uniref:Very short patch repair endonuclease n=1 Tax=Cellulomonas terrae TaxID=311234 RepID=A0A511JPE9_9CELL|nr:very short patch repair endonuclease [Cellulomonas terrae]GEL99878.1 very short patch repair endonuclease [Cellulomonas terrae]